MNTEQLIGLGLIGGAALLMRRGGKSAGKSPGGDRLGRTRWIWADTPYSERNLHGSILVMGQSGSGKSSGSGVFIRDHLLAIPDSGGLVITSKPQERNDWIRAAFRAGRQNDLIVFAPDEKYRINFLDQLGGDPTNIVNAIDVISDLMSGEKGAARDPFWPKSREELFYNAVSIIRLAGYAVSGTAIQDFINGAAATPEQFRDDDWRKKIHYRVLERARILARSQLDRFAIDKAYPFWVNTWPSKDPKTRSNVLAEAMSVLDQLTRPEVRALVGSETNVEMDLVFKGKIILCDTPLQTMGQSGKFVSATLKYVFQRKLLARDAGPDDPTAFLYIDECQNHITKYDSVALAEQRGHRGCSVYLTQGLTAIEDLIGEKTARSLCTNFQTKVFHQLGSNEDAAYASGLLGQQLQVTTGGSPDREGNFNANFSENWHPELQPGVFLGSELRASGGVAPAIVVSGEKFKSGKRYAIVPFRQG